MARSKWLWWYLYALCWGLKSFDEALGITWSHIPNIHVSPLEPRWDREHPPVWVSPYMTGPFQEAWQVTWKVQVGFSGHSQPHDLRSRAGASSWVKEVLNSYSERKRELFHCFTWSTSSSNVEISSRRNRSASLVKSVSYSASRPDGGGHASMLTEPCGQNDRTWCEFIKADLHIHKIVLVMRHEILLVELTTSLCSIIMAAGHGRGQKRGQGVAQSYTDHIYSLRL